MRRTMRCESGDESRALQTLARRARPIEPRRQMQSAGVKQFDNWRPGGQNMTGPGVERGLISSGFRAYPTKP